MTGQSDNKQYTAIGVISGTSMDGIDVCLVRTDGCSVSHVSEGRAYPYPDAVRKDLQDIIADPGRAASDPLDDLTQRVTDAHVSAVKQYAAQLNEARAADLCGFHGQTVFHDPKRRLTRQLFDPVRAAAALDLPVVSDFRSADVAAGGEGAPFAPLYHRAIIPADLYPVAVLNLGGVGNITYLDPETTLAFDTGPASAILDDFVMERMGVAFDQDGRTARAGEPDGAVVGSLLEDSFFQQPPPKSLDRNAFHRHALTMVSGLDDSDGAATLSEFSAESVRLAIGLLPDKPRKLIVCGGGRHNTYLMERLRDLLRIPVRPVEDTGYDGDYIEAQCFGFLAVRSLLGLPLSLPSTTGVPEPLTGGKMVYPEA